MIVTVVADVLGEQSNGITICALNLIQALSDAGHTVRVLCADMDKKNKEGYYVLPAINVGPFQHIVDENGIVMAKPDAMEIGRALKGSDLVHVMAPFPMGRVAVKMANSFGIPVTAGFHVQPKNVTAHFAGTFNSRFWNDFLFKDFWKHFYAHVDAVHYPIQFIRDMFERSCGHKTNGYVISNGTPKDFLPREVERPEEWKGKFLIVCTGRYSKEKKQILLLKALTHSKHRDEILPVFPGQGRKEKELRHYSERHGLSPIFRLFGRQEMSDLLNMADLYVLSSEVEIESVACLEAMTCGAVPVMNDSPYNGNRSYALHPENLFAMNNPRDLARKIDWWIEHPEVLKTTREQYIRFSEGMSIDKSMKKMVAMVEEVARTKKEPRCRNAARKKCA